MLGQWGIAPHQLRRHTAAPSGATRPGRSAPSPVFSHCPRSAARLPAFHCNMLRGHAPSAVVMRPGLTVHPAQVYSQPLMGRGSSRGLDVSGCLGSAGKQHCARGLTQSQILLWAWMQLHNMCTHKFCCARASWYLMQSGAPCAAQIALKGGVGDASHGGQAHGRPYRYVPPQLQRRELTWPARRHSTCN